MPGGKLSLIGKNIKKRGRSKKKLESLIVKTINRVERPVNKLKANTIGFMKPVKIVTCSYDNSYNLAITNLARNVSTVAPVNNAYRPDGNGRNGAVNGWNFISAYYTTYKVLSVTAKATFYAASTNSFPVQVVTGFSNVNSYGNTLYISDFAQRLSAKAKTLTIPGSSRGVVTIYQKATIWDILGVTKEAYMNDSLYQAGVANAPTVPVYLFCAAGFIPETELGTGAIVCSVRVTYKYRILCTDLKEITLAT